MRTGRKMSAVAAGVAALSLVLAACSSDDDGSKNDSTGGTGGGDASEVEVFTWWASGSEKLGLDALVKVFDEQHPDTKFVNGAVAGGAGSAAKDLLQSRLQAGDPPDTFQAHAGAELSDYIDAGQVEDVSALYDEFGLRDAFPKDLVDRLTVDGKIYSVPTNIHRANVVWVNTDVLSSAGIDPTAAPASIDAWIADLEKLRQAGVATPLSVGMEWTQLHLFETVLIAELGPDAYNGLFDGSTAWDSAGVSSAIEKFGTLLDYTNADAASLDWDGATQYVLDGDAGYNVMGDWAEAAFAQAGWTYGTEYTTWAVPGTDGIFDFLADSFVLTVGAPHPESTISWLTAISSTEGQKAFNLAKGSIPARTDTVASDYPAYQQTAIESWGGDTVVSSIAHGAAASNAWKADMSSAIGRFVTDGNADALQSGLVAAAASALG